MALGVAGTAGSCVTGLAQTFPGKGLSGSRGNAVGWQGHGGLGVMVLPLHTDLACGCPGVLLEQPRDATEVSLG